jgi:ribosome recycling factor
MYDDVISLGRAGMEKSIDALKKELARIRTGRASTTLLDDVRIDYYGTPTPLNQIGTLTVPEPRLITIQPWEKNLIPAIERAILKSDLGLNPSSDGQLVRIAIPPLTEERRKEMSKMTRRIGEDAKIAVRNARREANENLKKLEKDKEISEDELKRGEKEIQDLTDGYVKKVDEIVATKEFASRCRRDRVPAGVEDGHGVGNVTEADGTAHFVDDEQVGSLSQRLLAAVSEDILVIVSRFGSEADDHLAFTSRSDE